MRKMVLLCPWTLWDPIIALNFFSQLITKNWIQTRSLSALWHSDGQQLVPDGMKMCKQMCPLQHGHLTLSHFQRHRINIWDRQNWALSNLGREERMAQGTRITMWGNGLWESQGNRTSSPQETPDVPILDPVWAGCHLWPRHLTGSNQRSSYWWAK